MNLKHFKVLKPFSSHENPSLFSPKDRVFKRFFSLNLYVIFSPISRSHQFWTMDEELKTEVGTFWYFYYEVEQCLDTSCHCAKDKSWLFYSWIYSATRQVTPYFWMLDIVLALTLALTHESDWRGRFRAYMSPLLQSLSFPGPVSLMPKGHKMFLSASNRHFEVPDVIFRKLLFFSIRFYIFEKLSEVGSFLWMPPW